jgi:hypothetical protein
MEADPVANTVRAQPFSTMLETMRLQDIRIGGNRRSPKAEDAVAICEGGLAYEGTMIVASLADLCDDGDDMVRGALELLRDSSKQACHLALLWRCTRQALLTARSQNVPPSG